MPRSCCSSACACPPAARASDILTSPRVHARIWSIACRGRGLGSQVYDALEARAAEFGRLALEVNIDPPNDASLAFHAGRGFEPVGERFIERPDGIRIAA